MGCGLPIVNSGGWIVSLVDDKIFSTALSIIESDNHILNECSKSDQKFYRLPKIRCTRFLPVSYLRASTFQTVKLEAAVIVHNF